MAALCIRLLGERDKAAGLTRAVAALRQGRAVDDITYTVDVALGFAPCQPERCSWIGVRQLSCGQTNYLSTPNELTQLSRDSGARRVLIPTANRRQALELDEEFLELAQFYNDPKGAVDRALGTR